MLLSGDNLSKNNSNQPKDILKCQNFKNQKDYNDNLNTQRKRLKDRIILAKDLKSSIKMKNLVKLKNYKTAHAAM